MGKVNYAAIDIGSNAVRLLIKQIDDDPAGILFTKMLLVRVPLRLGADTFRTGTVSPGKAKKLLRLMKAYRQLIKIYEVADYRACATAAMRDARNGRELIGKIRRETGLTIEIIGGREEAQLVYDNHIEYLLDKERNYLYVDVGGGSTEASLISGGRLVSSRSYDIGTVRMLENRVRPEVPETMETELSGLAGRYPGLTIIGSGGNINKLFRLAHEPDQPDKQHAGFSVERLRQLAETLKGYSVEERMRVFGLKPDRADVIVPAAEIFLRIARYTGAETILVPTIGLADGIIDWLYQHRVEKKRLDI